MNDSIYKRKVDLILRAAKNVLDDPFIDFDTPEGAKEALVNEISRIKKQEETDDAEMTIPEKFENVVPSMTPVERIMDDLFDFSDMHDDIHENFNRFMKLFDEACQKYGYQKRKDGSYHLKGDPVVKVGKYINDHWFDIPMDDEKDDS
mgnify:FL=1|jgi:hypothetical protein